MTASAEQVRHRSQGCSFVRGGRRRRRHARRRRVAVAAAKRFEMPRLVPAASVSPRERIDEPSVVTPRGAVQRQERDELARACRSASACRGRCGRRPRPRYGVDLGARVALAAEQQHATRAGGRAGRRPSRRRRSEPGSSAIAASSASSRSVASLAAGCRSIRAPGRLRGGEPGRRDGVEVADREVDVQAERERPVDAAVGGDHGRALGRKRRHGPARGLPSGNDDDRFVLHAHTSAGITQIRFCGSAARQPPSQPGRARAPRSLAILALPCSSGRRAARPLLEAGSSTCPRPATLRRRAVFRPPSF